MTSEEPWTTTFAKQGRFGQSGEFSSFGLTMLAQWTLGIAV